jgi:DNA-directed RNA polymerase specialized sigma24 family protein
MKTPTMLVLVILSLQWHQKAKAHDYSQFSEFYQVHYIVALKLAAKYLGSVSHENAEDVVHNAVHRIMAGGKHIKIKRSYFFQAVKYAALDAIKGQKSNIISGNLDDVEETLYFDDFIEGEFYGDRCLERARKSISSIGNESMNLRFDHGYSWAEIGKYIGKSDKTAKKIVLDSMLKFNNCIG